MQQRKNKRVAARALNAKSNTRKKQAPDNRSVYGSKKSLTQKPDDVSGKGPTKAKVLVVHRTGFVRSGVLSLIANSMQFMACGETDEAPLARELFVRHKPKLVLLGLTLRGGDGFQLIKDFCKLEPAAATLVLSERNDALSIRRAFRAGARGSDINSLSDRELEIFSFIGRGFSVSELAIELHVSVKTIETHQMRIKEKLALHSAAELRQKAREWLARSALNRIREEPEAA